MISTNDIKFFSLEEYMSTYSLGVGDHPDIIVLALKHAAPGSVMEWTEHGGWLLREPETPQSAAYRRWVRRVKERWANQDDRRGAQLVDF